MTYTHTRYPIGPYNSLDRGSTCYTVGRYSTQYRIVGTYAVPEVGTVPDMLNIHDILAIIGHRFGHQSTLDESSG